jgi:hypothetical protein
MAHKLNINFTLYTAFDENSLASIEAVSVLKNSGVEFSHVHYFDAQQKEDVLASLKTWFAETGSAGLPTAYPFVIYDQAFDITDTPPRIPVLIHGLDAIKAADWVSLKDFKG